jgi:hypothetical protein
MDYCRLHCTDLPIPWLAREKITGEQPRRLRAGGVYPAVRTAARALALRLNPDAAITGR